jgi:hypothetical protein
MGEPLNRGSRVGLAMVPTLVFGLVIADVLRDSFAVSDAIFGGLIVYTLATTVLPGFLLGPGQPLAPESGDAADSAPRGRLEFPVV